MKMIRQGDVLLMKVGKQDTSKAKKLSDKHVVLAYGEVTGHSHQINSPGAELFALETNLEILRLTEQASLVHEEHTAAILDPGDYQVIRQRENTPLGWRVVVD